MSDEKKGAVLTGEELDEIARLEKVATAAPWTAAVMGGVQVGTLHENTAGFCGGGLGELFRIEPECGHYIGREDLEERSAALQAGADERFIVALRNAAPALLRRARELEAGANFFEAGRKAGRHEAYEVANIERSALERAGLKDRARVAQDIMDRISMGGTKEGRRV